MARSLYIYGNNKAKEERMLPLFPNRNSKHAQFQLPSQKYLQTDRLFQYIFLQLLIKHGFVFACGLTLYICPCLFFFCIGLTKSLNIKSTFPLQKHSFFQDQKGLTNSTGIPQTINRFRTTINNGFLSSKTCYLPVGVYHLQQFKQITHLQTLSNINKSVLKSASL